MVGMFDKLGLRFVYPETWEVDESEILNDNASISVYSPSGAYWQVVIYPRERDPAELLGAALQAMRQVYDNLDAEAVHEHVEGHTLNGFDMNFFCLDLTNTSQVRCLHQAGRTLLVFCQAEDREFEEVGEVFRAMTTSLLKNLPADAL